MVRNKVESFSSEEVELQMIVLGSRCSQPLQRMPPYSHSQHSLLQRREDRIYPLEPSVAAIPLNSVPCRGWEEATTSTSGCRHGPRRLPDGAEEWKNPPENNGTRAGYSRGDQFYASYPAGTEMLTDTAKLYKAALGNCFEVEDWGPIEFCIMAKHFERQGKSPYAYHAQYVAHLLSHGQLDGSG
uniref:Uncharacterized protein n=1 Tax=Chenopodium quinoa TaxID=63459 RepID=A0A803LJI0_CHEQI